MYFLRTSFSITDVLVFLVMAFVLAFVVYFVLVSRRRLQAIIEESKRQSALTGSGYHADVLKPTWVTKKKIFPVEISLPFPSAKSYKTGTVASVTAKPGVVQDLKLSIRQQQKTLELLLTRVDKMEMSEEQSLMRPITSRALDEKEAELQKTKQQLSAAQKVAGRVTEVYEELDLLQQKLADLEESDAKTTALTSELEEMQEAYELLQTNLEAQEEKTQQLTKENEDLQQQLAETASNLNEATTQRQQLQKRVQLLENINAELHQLSEANTKLKAELRRIAELESLLSLVSDERDILLKKRLS